MRPSLRLAIPAALAAAFCLFPAAAQAQTCPNGTSVCVESQTTLVYDQTSNTMDAFTTTTADYDTNTYYDVCVTLRIWQVDTTDPNNSLLWTILASAPQQKSCVMAGTAAATQADSVVASGTSSVTASPLGEYVAVGAPLLTLGFHYRDIVPDCVEYCSDGYYYDAFDYTDTALGDPESLDWLGYYYMYPGGNQGRPVTVAIIHGSPSLASAWGVPLPVIGDGSQANDGIVNFPSYTAANAILNSNGTIVIFGSGLTAAGNELYPGPVVTDTTGGITISPTYRTDGQINATYSVAANTSVGAHYITVSTYAGTSNAVSMNIGDPTPVITSLSPATWQAGSTFTLTISGTGFGTHPGVQVSGPGLTTTTYTCSGTACDTQIQVSLTIPGNAPGGTASVTVTSAGYGGSGFVAAASGQPGSATAYATEEAAAGPVPQIYFNGTLVGSAVIPVVVGQKISLTTMVPGIENVATSSWTQPPGTVIANYVASTGSGAVTAFPVPAAGQCQTLAENCLTFYWVDAGGNRQLTYAYTLSNGQPGNSVIATFSVIGPTGPNIMAAVGAAQILPISGNKVAPGGTPTLLLNGVQVSPGNQAGIALTGSASLPAGNPGAYVWVQLVSKYQVRVRSGAGAATCTGVQGLPVLDNAVPYPNTLTTSSPNDTATDGPRIALVNATAVAYAEVAESFAATMYLQWNPSLPNSIPVPLANLSWQFTGDAINTLATQPNNTTFALGCGSGMGSPCHVTVPGAEPSSGYPIWGATLSNGALTCQ